MTSKQFCQPSPSSRERGECRRDLRDSDSEFRRVALEQLTGAILRRDRLASEARLARAKAELPPQVITARTKAQVELRGQVLRRTYRYEDGKDAA